jgi:hypothetical protein
VNDWNRIILAIKAGRFENELEYEYIKQGSSNKSVFSQSFTLRKNLKFGLEVLAPGVQEVKLEDSVEVQSLLKTLRPVIEGAAHALPGKALEGMYIRTDAEHHTPRAAGNHG